MDEKIKELIEEMDRDLKYFSALINLMDKYEIPVDIVTDYKRRIVNLQYLIAKTEILK